MKIPSLKIKYSVYFGMEKGKPIVYIAICIIKKLFQRDFFYINQYP